MEGGVNVRPESCAEVSVQLPLPLSWPAESDAPAGTPLMVACMYGRLAAVKLLVRLGALLWYEKNGSIVSAVQAALPFPHIVRWLMVERFTELRLLSPCQSSSPGNVGSTIDAVPWLNLDLVFAEDWDNYLNTKLMPPSRKRYICRLENTGSVVEEIEV